MTPDALNITAWLLASIPALVVGDALTTALLFLLIPVLLFLLLAYWLDKNKEHFHFLLGFEENKRYRPRNSFLSSLITQPDNSRVWGVDESGRWAGIVDWKVTKSRGASFAIIKCTEGTVNSSYFVENITGVLAAGLVGGAYHWLHRNAVVSCKAQANAAWNRIKAFPKILPLIIDLESTKWNGVQHNPNYADVELFVDEYTRLSSRKPILYSSPGYLRALGSMPMSLRAKLRGIHIAHYGVATPEYADWIFWQASAEGDASVLTPNTLHKKEVDIDYFRGDLGGLYALAGLGDPTPIPPPDPEPIGDTMQGTVTTFTNIRAGNSKSTQDLGDLLAGDRVTYTKKIPGIDGLNYCVLTNATRNGVPIKMTDGRDVKDLVLPVYAYSVNIKDDPQPTPAPVVGRVTAVIDVQIFDREGKLVGKYYEAIDKPLEGVE